MKIRKSVLVMVIGIFVLCGCGAKSEESVAAPETTESVSAEAAPLEEVGDVTSSDQNTMPDEAIEEETAGILGKFSVEEQVLLDDEELLIKVFGVVEEVKNSSLNDTMIKIPMQIKEKKGRIFNRYPVVTVDGIKIGGVVTTNFDTLAWYEDGALLLSSLALRTMGIYKPQEIVLTYYKGMDEEREPLGEPLVIKTDAYGAADATIEQENKGIVAYDENGFKATVIPVPAEEKEDDILPNHNMYILFEKGMDTKENLNLVNYGIVEDTEDEIGRKSGFLYQDKNLVIVNTSRQEEDNRGTYVSGDTVKVLVDFHFGGEVTVDVPLP